MLGRQRGKEFVKVLGGNKKAFKTIIIIIPIIIIALS